MLKDGSRVGVDVIICATGFDVSDMTGGLKIIGRGGRNLREGIAQRVQDWRHNGGLPASVDKSPFKVGGNLAATPGDVVYRSEHLELIQYRPQTPTVHGTPLVIVPPQINKYYVWDLAPGRSLIEFLVQQGFEIVALHRRAAIETLKLVAALVAQ